MATNCTSYHMQICVCTILILSEGIIPPIDHLNFDKTEDSPVNVYMFFRISLQEETNRMSANALAIVFAPCILRCPDSTDPLQSVQDIGKTTA